MPSKIDLSGQRFGRLLVVEGGHRTASGDRAWLCRCDCGNTRTIRTSDLRSGNNRSCGCLYREGRAETSRTHGQCDSPLYLVWKDMRARTQNPNRKGYSSYGGRGIQVCERWQSFEAFVADMGDRPEGCTLDRIDVNGDYTPGNCRWATRAEQARNTRRNVLLTWHGYTLPMVDWADLLEINRKTLVARIRRYGWSVERALTEGVDPDRVTEALAMLSNGNY